MGLTVAAKNAALDYLGANKLLYCSGHTVDAPGSGGTNEVTGGTYARVAVSWSAASGGVLTSTTTPFDLNMPSGTNLRSIGLWDSASGGTFQGVADIVDETYGSDGVYEVQNLTYTY